MRLKHNKKRNTAFVYEALVRELTESVVKNNKNKQNKIVSIIKDHFTKGSTLTEELELYKTIYETRDIEKSRPKVLNRVAFQPVRPSMMPLHQLVLDNPSNEVPPRTTSTTAATPF